MAVPDFQSFMLPVLKLSAEADMTLQSAITPVSQAMALSEEDLLEMTPSGRKTKVADRISWSLIYMTKAGLLERPSRGVYRITDEGRLVLASSPDKISSSFLERYDSFKNFRYGHADDNLQIKQKSGSIAHDGAVIDKTPDEHLEEAYNELEEILLSDLKEQILKISPTAFEKLIIELMKALNYGARGLSQHMGQSGDGGIDGIITEDILGLDSIYLQAKRYTEGSVGRDRIQAFAGAMDGKSVIKGVFVTTSTFTKGAREYAATSPKHLRLIDGDELTKLMFDHGVGVKITQTLEVKRLDDGFFIELDE